MADFVIVAALVLICGAAGRYIYKAKKSGAKCIGCAAAKNCGGSCGLVGASCSCGEHGGEKGPAEREK